MANSAKEEWKMRKSSMIRRSIRMSFANIRNNRMRSFLTMLGIIIGVAAVIALVTTVSAVTSYMIGRFSSMGAGMLEVSVPGTVLKPGLTENDLNELSAIDNVASISPSVSVVSQVAADGKVSDKVSVQGKNEQYFLHNEGLVTSGRALFVSDMQNDVKVCVIDSTCAKTFFPGQNPIGQEIRITGVTYKIVGLCGSSDNLMGTMTISNDDAGTIYIPYRNALTMNGTNAITSVDLYVSDTSMMDETEASIKQLLNNTFNQNENAFYIFNMESLLSTMNTMVSMMTTMLGGIASIALLVGGIGIMNMMLVTVTERTKEIGLRKALGAEPGVIQLQFLLESIILSVTGGVIGIAFGELLSYIACHLINTQFILNPGAIALGFFFSLAVGILFGWAPARKASQLNPIDALRSE
jgi:putative ABC transport system permease protein